VPRTGVTHDDSLTAEAVVALANTTYGPEASLAPDGEWPMNGDVVDALVTPGRVAAMLRAQGIRTPSGQPDARQLRRLREIRAAAQALTRGAVREYQDLARGLLGRYSFTLGTSGRLEHGSRGWDGFIVEILLRLVEISKSSRLKTCRNPRCRWAFLDDSPSGRRVWCDMSTCGNRDKVARFRSRQRAGPRRRARAVRA
jgi:hypothetical protein